MKAIYGLKIYETKVVNSLGKGSHLIYHTIYLMDGKDIKENESKLIEWTNGGFGRNYMVSRFNNFDELKSHLDNFAGGMMKNYYLWEICEEGIDDIFEEISKIELMREIV